VRHQLINGAGAVFKEEQAASLPATCSNFSARHEHLGAPASMVSGSTAPYMQRKTLVQLPTSQVYPVALPQDRKLSFLGCVPSSKVAAAAD